MSVEKFPVEAGHILLFARAIGDKNPVYYGEAGDVIAPPTFVQASAQFDPEYFLRPKIGDLHLNGLEPCGQLLEPPMTEVGVGRTEGQKIIHCFGHRKRKKWAEGVSGFAKK